MYLFLEYSYDTITQLPLEKLLKKSNFFYTITFIIKKFIYNSIISNYILTFKNIKIISKIKIK